VARAGSPTTSRCPARRTPPVDAAFARAEADIDYARGRFVVAGTDRGNGLFELPDVLAVARDNEMHEPVFPNGCHVCEVEVDPETGAVQLVRYAAVDDVGRARPTCRPSRRSSTRCRRRPIRWGSRRAARAGPRPRPRSSATPYAIWRAIQAGQG
jgi:hypothetical protein